MKKVLIICSAGITSMLISKRINQIYNKKDIDITTHFTLGEIFLKKADLAYDLFILSPQVEHLRDPIGEMLAGKDVLYLEASEYSIGEDKLARLAKKIEERIGGR
ncbi:MAG: hypothetical protein SOU08_05285 [Anaerococcus sp.]|nr:hypothetical protein [Peptoniphilaceae bacterium]MDY2919034.1 hypothetical protein [Anaerococcus sp.]